MSKRNAPSRNPHLFHGSDSRNSGIYHQSGPRALGLGANFAAEKVGRTVSVRTRRDGTKKVQVGHVVLNRYA